MQHLQTNTLLQNGKYKIENVLGQGGFGITYVALQAGLNRKVVVKEFFMKEYCERNSDTSYVALGTSGSHELVKRFKEKFIKEAQNIAALNHQHIIRIHDIFEENGTAYYVMEYHEKGSLQTLLDSCHTLSETEALRYIRQIADALRYIHTRNMNHLDVKPANILLDDSNNTVLIDFGLSKHYDEAGHQSSTTLVDISYGYAPIEQYLTGGVSEFSPATDIYSLGATLYRMLIGDKPPAAQKVYEDGLPALPATISSEIRKAIASAMKPRRKDRPQSIDAFLSMLDNGKNKVDEDETVIQPAPSEPKQPSYTDKTQILHGEKTPALVNFTQTVKGVSFNMIAVKGGTFTMGATPEQGSDAYDDEKPAHQVTLSDYYIGETEVTQELWQAVMGSNPSYYTGNVHRPVECVNWNECQEFIKKLNQLTGKTFRLPTEAEWEYAARGGNKSRGYKYAGSNNIDDVAWYKGNSYYIDKTQDYGTHPVKQKQANELGIYDMSGNVYEWCQDWFGDYSSDSQTNPTGPSSGSDRVLRGGAKSWSDTCGRVSCRRKSSPASRGINYGLRLVLTPQDNSNAVEQSEPSEIATADIENFTQTVNGVSFNMIAVKGGTFTMGATSEQSSDAEDREKPAHQVTLSDYYIGETVVNQELWQAVMGSNPSYFTRDLQRLVKEDVSWEDCQEFIWKLNQLTGKTFRLPTEAEWEYAARGGSQSRGYKYAGSNNIDDVAWYYSYNGWSCHEVKRKKANELGIYDMSGNVCEWCQDWYGDYSSSSQTNPTGPSSGSGRVLRGGNTYYGALSCRVSSRLYDYPASRDGHYGLRLVLTPQDNSNAVEEQPEPSEPTTASDIENFTQTVKGVSFNMIAVKGGTFTMGATPELGSDARDWEKPAHEVTLSDYYIGETEVTQELWRAVMGYNPSKFKGKQGIISSLISAIMGNKSTLQRPVEDVSWEDCQKFIWKLNQLTGKTFRLPTEAEWEYAARGGNKSRGYKYAGSDYIDDVAWYRVNSEYKGETHPDYGTHPVKQKQANELGLYDMSGNVLEWCQDRYGDYSSSSQNNPTGPPSGSLRVLRGGCWNLNATFCRVSNRDSENPKKYGYYSTGLRLSL